MQGIVWRDVSVRGGDAVLLDRVSLSCGRGEIVSILGPNGAGKSTLLRVGIGAMEPLGGSVTLNGQLVGEMSVEARARRLGYLPQSPQLAWPARVQDVVALGRFAFGGVAGQLSSEDAEAVDEALARTGLIPLRKRLTTTLSGGERARMHFARVLAGRPDVILADEPFAALDPGQALQLARLLRAQASEGRTIVLTVHDMDIAARLSDRVLLLNEGRAVASGRPADVLTAKNIGDVYDVHAEIRRTEGGGVRVMLAD